MSVQHVMDLSIELISIGLFLAMIAIELVTAVAGLHFAQLQWVMPAGSASQANSGQVPSDWCS